MICFSHLLLHLYFFALSCIRSSVTLMADEIFSSLTGRQLLVHTRASRNQITGGTLAPNSFDVSLSLSLNKHMARGTPKLFASPLANFHLFCFRLTRITENAYVFSYLRTYSIIIIITIMYFAAHWNEPLLLLVIIIIIMIIIVD